MPLGTNYNQSDKGGHPSSYQTHQTGFHVGEHTKRGGLASILAGRKGGEVGVRKEGSEVKKEGQALSN